MKSSLEPTLRLVRSLLTGSTIGLAACAGAAASGSDVAALEARVLALIGDAACKGHEQCRTLPFGAKACGGPQAYLAWSTLRTNEAALTGAADSYATARREQLKKLDMASDCALVPDPGAYCAVDPVGTEGAAPASAGSAPAGGANGVCRLRSSRPAGGAGRLAN